jgi:hypothetical protein
MSRPLYQPTDYRFSRLEGFQIAPSNHLKLPMYSRSTNSDWDVAAARKLFELLTNAGR